MLTAGREVRCLDLAVEPLDTQAVRAAQLIAFSVPMHTALRPGMQTARRVRVFNHSAHVCFYGLYASLNAGYLLAHGADSVAGMARRNDSHAGPRPAPVVQCKGEQSIP